MAAAVIFKVETLGSTLLIVPLRNVSSLAEETVSAELSGMLEQLDRPKTVNVVVDFAAVGFFGSSLLEALRALWKSVHAQGGKMALCNVTEVGREVLHVAKFDTLWPIFAARDEALQYVRS